MAVPGAPPGRVEQGLGRAGRLLFAVTAAVSAWIAVSLLAVPTWPLVVINLVDRLRAQGSADALPSADLLADIIGHCQVTAGYGREAILCPFEQPLASFAPELALAAVANEDKRFLAHPGIDVYRLPVAVASTAMGWPSGASTITQQTARILMLDPDDDSLRRKLREMVLAFRLEAVWSKERILIAYLNTVPLGRGIFGFERGARYFIGKPASELSLADALILVAKVPGPERRDPRGKTSTADLEAWASAAATAAARMTDEGFVDANEAAAAAAEARRRILEDRVFTGNRALRTGAQRPFEYRRVRDLARRQAAAAGADLSRAARLFVNIDPAFQRQADAISRESPKGFDTHALFVDPVGDMLAISGGDYARSPFNAAFDGMFSLASLGKIPVLVAASTQPGLLAQSFSTEPLDGYSPREDSRHCRGDMLLAKAAALSCNRPFVRATALMRDEVRQAATDFGLTVPLNELLTPTGGLYGNPLLVARMVGAVAAGGRMTPPAAFVAAANEGGRIVATAPPRKIVRVMSRESADAVNAILRQPVIDEYGTARAGAGSHQAAGVFGKTGTALEGRDAWFAGYTRDFTGVILSHALRGAGGMTGGAYPAEQFGRVVDTYWVPRNAGAAVEEAPALSRLEHRLWRHRALDVTRLSLMLLAAVLLFVVGEVRRTRRNDGAGVSYPLPPAAADTATPPAAAQ
jgi:penicillin-binding protein 1A